MSVLGRQLAAAGLRVEDTPRLGRTSAWSGVEWIMVHHYAGSEDPTRAAGEAHYLKTAAGRYPPLSQLYVDLTGRVWVISQERPGQPSPGRASHAGQGRYPGIPTDRANELALGIEVQCDGTHPLSTHRVAYRVLMEAIAVCCRYYGVPASRVIGHKEWSTTGKIDPRDNMDRLRRDVAAALTTPTTSEVTDMFLAESQNGRSWYLVGPTSAVQLPKQAVDDLARHGVPVSTNRILDETVRHLVHNPSARGGVRQPGLDHAPGDYEQ